MWRLTESTHSFTRTLKNAVPTEFRTLGKQPTLPDLGPNLHEQLGDAAHEAVNDIINFSRAAVELGPEHGHESLAQAKKALGTLKMIKLAGDVAPQHRPALKAAMRQAEKHLDYSRLAVKKEIAFDKLAQKAEKPGSIVSGGRFARVKALLPEKVSEEKLQKNLKQLMKGLPRENDASARNEARVVNLSRLVENNDKVMKIKADVQHLRKTGTLPARMVDVRIPKNLEHLQRYANHNDVVPKLAGQIYVAFEKNTGIIAENEGIRAAGPAPFNPRYAPKDSSSLGESLVKSGVARGQITDLKGKLKVLEDHARIAASTGLSPQRSSEVALVHEKFNELLVAAKKGMPPQDAQDRRVYKAERENILALAKARMGALEKIQKSEASLQKLMNESAQRGHLRTENPSYPSRILHKALAKTGLTSSYSEAEFHGKINKLEQRYAGMVRVPNEHSATAGVAALPVPQHLDQKYRPSLETLAKLRDTKSEIKTALKRVANSGLGSVKKINGTPYEDKRASLDTLHEEYKQRSFMPAQTPATLNQHLSKYAVDAEKSLTKSLQNSFDNLEPWRGRGLLTEANFQDKATLAALPHPLQMLQRRISHLNTLNPVAANQWKEDALAKFGAPGEGSPSPRTATPPPTRPAPELPTRPATPAPTGPAPARSGSPAARNMAPVYAASPTPTGRALHRSYSASWAEPLSNFPYGSHEEFAANFIDAIGPRPSEEQTGIRSRNSAVDQRQMQHNLSDGDIHWGEASGAEFSDADSSPRSSPAGTPWASPTGTPRAPRPGTPWASPIGTPQSSRPGTPQSSWSGTPHSSWSGTPQSSWSGTPQSSRPGTPQRAQPRTLHNLLFDHPFSNQAPGQQ